MPISVECEICGKKYKVADAMAGRTIKCKECGGVVDIPGGKSRAASEPDDDDDFEDSTPTPRPTSRGRSAGNGKKTGKRSKPINPLVWILGGVGVMLLICCGVGGVVMMNLSRSVQQKLEQAQNEARSLTPPSPASADPAKAATSSNNQQMQAAATDVLKALPEDASLPPYTSANYAAAPAIGGASPWVVTSDAVSPLPPEILGAPLSLGGDAGPCQQLVIVDGENPQAVLHLGTPTDPSRIPSFPRTAYRAVGVDMFERTLPERQKFATQWVQIVSLKNPSESRKIEIPGKWSLFDLSADGTRVVVQHEGSKDRLDVYSLPDGKHVVGFRPYQALKSEPDWTVKHAVFTDANHIATSNIWDEFVLWEIPGCKPLLRAVSTARPKLSPGRKYLAIATAEGIELRDATSGSPKGLLALKGNVTAMEFHPGGNRLAVLLADRGANYLYTADLAAGKITGEIPVPVEGERIQWCSDRYLLLNGARLFDLDSKTVVWTYQLPAGGAIASGNTDLRVIYAVPKSARLPELQLLAATLPEPKAADALAPLMPAPTYLLKPGDAISVQYALAGHPSRPNISQELESLVQKAVEQTGISIKEGQAIKLTATLTVTPGETIQTQRMGAPIGSGETIPAQQLNAVFKTEYASGDKVLWSRELRAQNFDRLVMKFIPPGKTLQQAVDEDLWKKVLDHAKSLPLPGYLFDPATADGVGKSDLGPEGIVPRS